MSFLLVLLILPHYPLDICLSSVYMVSGLVNSPFRFKGAWSEEFKLYSIGREFAELGLYFGMSEYNEKPRLRTPAPLSPDPLEVKG